MKKVSYHNRFVAILLTAFHTLLSFSTQAQSDITRYGGVLSTQYPPYSEAENVYKLLDNNSNTKLYVNYSSAWVSFQPVAPVELKGYSITSANDSPQRDPKNWTLEASNDNTTWTALDQKSNESFPSRFLRKAYSVTTTTSYRYFRLSMQNNSGSSLQLAEIELLAFPNGIDSLAAPIFTSNRTFIPVGESVSYTNRTTGATNFSWIFEGGTPSTSTSENPTVTYNSAGNYPVQLTVTGAAGENMIKVTDYIRVGQECTWGTNFLQPTILFIDYDNGATIGSQVFHQLIPDPVAYMTQKCLEVAKTLYRNSSDAPKFSELTFQLKNENFVAYKWGDGEKIGIAVSTQHLTTIYNASGGNPQVIKDEIDGILFHEVTHGYNNSPRTGGSYDGSSPFWAYTEGIADAVRIYNGLHQSASLSQNSSLKWLTGYTTTGFFLQYLTQVKDKNFISKFNKATKDLGYFWSFDKATNLVLGENIAPLWAQYVSFINGGGVLDRDGVYPWTLDCYQVLSNEEITPSDNFTLYPNPVQGKLTFHKEDGSQLIEYAVTNLEGKVVLSGKTAENQIDCSRLASGSYILQLNQDGAPAPAIKFVVN